MKLQFFKPIILIYFLLPSLCFGEDFFEYFNSYLSKEFSFDVYFEDDYVFDEIIMDAYKSKRFFPVSLKAAEGKNDVMALLKLECEKKICNVTGNFDFTFGLEGISNRIIRKFEVSNYSTSLSSNNVSLTDTLNSILDVKVTLNREVMWHDTADLLSVVDKADSFVPEAITVYTDHFTKDQKVDLVKKCFNKCTSVSVYGEPFFDDLGNLSLKAFEIKNLEE